MRRLWLAGPEGAFARGRRTPALGGLVAYRWGLRPRVSPARPRPPELARRPEHQRAISFSRSTSLTDDARFLVARAPRNDRCEGACWRKIRRRWRYQETLWVTGGLCCCPRGEIPPLRFAPVGMTGGWGRQGACWREIPRGRRTPALGGLVAYRWGLRPRVSPARPRPPELARRPERQRGISFSRSTSLTDDARFLVARAPRNDRCGGRGGLPAVAGRAAWPSGTARLPGSVGCATIRCPATLPSSPRPWCRCTGRHV